MQELSNAELVEMIENGSGDAIEEIMRRYKRLVYQTCYRITYNIEDTEELIQDTFFKVYTHIRQLKNSASLPSWIVMIARTLSLMKVRAAMAEKRTPWYFPVDIYIDPSQELALALLRAFSKLSPHHAEVFRLRAMGFTSREIAAKSGLSIPCVKARYDKSRAAMRKGL
jgi:RNA polymerase sigma-70 factor (ECF subfamily)